MRIGELAETSGVSARSLRYYEQRGLLRSDRTDAGWRVYADDAVDRVVTIQHLYAAGLASDRIREILPCLDAEPDARTGGLEQVLEAEAARLEARRREIDREIEALRELRRETSLDG